MTCGRVLENCIFCGATGTTEEHVVADWVRRAFMRSKKRRLDFSGEATESGAMRLSTGEAIDTARVVCQPCNNQWLSRIDEAAATALKPAIQGRTQVHLGTAAQAATSAWVFKCALIFDALAHGERGPLSSLRARFARERLAPPGTTVYVGPAQPIPYQVEDLPEVAGLAMFGVRPTPGTLQLDLRVERPDGTGSSVSRTVLPIPAWTVMLGRVSAVISGLRAPVVPTPEWHYARVWPSSSETVTVSSEPSAIDHRAPSDEDPGNRDIEPLRVSRWQPRTNPADHQSA